MQLMQQTVWQIDRDDNPIEELWAPLKQAAQQQVYTSKADAMQHLQMLWAAQSGQAAAAMAAFERRMAVHDVLPQHQRQTHIAAHQQLLPPLPVMQPASHRQPQPFQVMAETLSRQCWRLPVVQLLHSLFAAKAAV
eukprot:gene8365-8549_t